MSGMDGCTRLPRWLLGAMTGVGALFMVAGAESWNADLSITPTISAIEVAYTLAVVPSVLFMAANYLDAEEDEALVRSNPLERRAARQAISCGNVRVELYLLAVATTFSIFGLGSFFAPPPPDARRSLLSGFYTALFLDLTLWTLWLSVQNRRERKLLLGGRFWPRSLAGEPRRIWRILVHLLRGHGDEWRAGP